MYKPARDAQRRNAARRAMLVVMALSLTGCQAARMPVPDALAGAERMSVSGRQGFQLNQRLRFGPYEVDPVKRSWTRGRDAGTTAAARQSERSQSYELTIRDGDAAHWFVACRASVASLRIDLGVVDMHPADRSALYCNIQSTTDPLIAWEMELRERRGRPLAGTLSLSSAMS